MITDYRGAPVEVRPTEDDDRPDLPDLSSLGTNPGRPMFKARKLLDASLAVLADARLTLQSDLLGAVRTHNEQQEVAAALDAMSPPSRAQRLVDDSRRATEPRGGVL